MGRNRLAVLIMMLIFAAPAVEGREISLNVYQYNGTFDIVAGGAPLLAGLYPEVSSFQETLTPEDGSLAIGGVEESGMKEDAVGRHVTSTIHYKNREGDDVVLVMVRMYPDAHAAAVGFKYSGDEKPRPEGGLRLVISSVPGFEKGMGAERFKQYWTRPVFADSADDFPSETQYIVWRDGSAGYGASIPLVGGGMKSTFAPYGNKLSVLQSSYDAGFKPRGAPVLALAWGGDPYETTGRLYRVGMSFMGNPGRLREDKSYPAVFENIGWCSWNAFYKNVTEEDVLKSAASFRQADFPVKYFIVDDGWQDTGSDWKNKENRRLESFGTIKEKFPSGIEGLVKKLKGEYGISHVGFRHAYQGYWGGVKPGSELAKKYKSNLLETLTGSLVPHPLDRKGYRFYYDYHNSLRQAGADLVKVDNQSTISVFTMNRIPLSFAARGWQDNLQASVEANFNGAVINCMCMTIENIYYWYSSNISRSSDDFFPDVPGNARVHAQHNIYNSMWYSELTYPDFDMFQSHHPQGEMHSVLRAISGGPIYITDSPGEQKWDILWKLVFNDGRILRPDVPARPTLDVLLIDPTENPVPLKAFTRVGEAGIIGAFNVLSTGGAVTGTVSPSDVEGFIGDLFAVYEHFSGKVEVVERDGDVSVNLPEYGSALYSIVPIKDGAAAIGLLNKYISPKAITKKVCKPGVLKITLREGGTFGAYLETEPRSVSAGGETLDKSAWTYENNLLKVEVPGAERVELSINTNKGCFGCE